MFHFYLPSFPTFGICAQILEICAQNLENNPQNNVGGKHCEVLNPLKSWLISIGSERENQELNACSLESKQLGPHYYPSFLGCLLLQSGKVHEGQATACLQEREVWFPVQACQYIHVFNIKLFFCREVSHSSHQRLAPKSTDFGSHDLIKFSQELQVQPDKSLRKSNE